MADAVRFPRLDDLEPVTVCAEDGVLLPLYRKARPEGDPVLLVHGASAWSKTFTTPAPDGDGPRSLADWLHARGFDVWLLDWRGSRSVVGSLTRSFGRLDAARRAAAWRGVSEMLDFDRAAEHDLAAALTEIRRERSAEGAPVADRGISAIGHCMGAGILAQAIAGGHVGGRELSHVVLSTLGLFYEPAFDGRVKRQDPMLERVLLGGEPIFTIDPACSEPWPDEVELLFRNWPRQLHPHASVDAASVLAFCDRLTFMYGPPFCEENLVPEIHDEGHRDSLRQQFGPIPLRMYAHAARNVRRGKAGRFCAKNDDEELVSDAARKRFGALERITLLTGAKNQLWHPKSVHLMYEWLRRGLGAEQVRKHLFRSYGHQDLLWGRRAAADVFGAIAEGLPGSKPDDVRS